MELESKGTLDEVSDRTLATAKVTLDELSDRLKSILKDQSSASIADLGLTSKALLDRLEGIVNRAIATMRELIGEADLKGWQVEITVPPIKIRLSKPIIAAPLAPVA